MTQLFFVSCPLSPGELTYISLFFSIVCSLFPQMRKGNSYPFFFFDFLTPRRGSLGVRRKPFAFPFFFFRRFLNFREGQDPPSLLSRSLSRCVWRDPNHSAMGRFPYFYSANRFSRAIGSHRRVPKLHLPPDIPKKKPAPLFFF